MADVNTDRLMKDLQDIVANTEQLQRGTADHTGVVAGIAFVIGCLAARR